MKSVIPVLIRTIFPAVLAVSASYGSVQAATITQVVNLGTTYVTNSVNYAADGSDMSGMHVTASWINLGNSTTTTSTQDWTSTGASSGGVRFVNNPGNNDFDLSINGDTSSTGAWDLSFTIAGPQDRYSLLSLSFDGVSGKIVFDICGQNNQYCQGSNVGTAGSETGNNFSGFSNTSANITATYSNAVALGNAAPVGDLFTNLRLVFGNGTTSGISEGNYSFTADTDQATTTVRAVPEPTTVALLGLGLLSFAASRRKSEKK